MTATFGSNYWSPTAATLVIKCNSYAKLAYYDAYFKYIQTIYYTYENSICVTMFDLKKCCTYLRETFLVGSSLLLSFNFFKNLQ